MSNNAYVGYMYGTPGSSTYAETHANINDSTIKEVIDTWYQKNLSSYSNYIADAIYCNDRQVVTNVNILKSYIIYDGNGTGVNQTAYAGMKRNYLGSISPTFECTEKNDRFTVNNDIGNGALTYPIGLITSDEAIMAGNGTFDYSTFTSMSDEQNYLYCEFPSWTMTPFAYTNQSSDSDGAATVGIVQAGSTYGFPSIVNDSSNNNEYAVRPVISLKSDAISGGSGTSDNPFYVNEEPSNSFPGVLWSAFN